MRILVTGGAGYIGSTTADHLVRAGHDVVALDNLGHGHREAIPDGIELVTYDVGDREKVKDLLARGFDAVIHFAALIEAGESMQFPELYRENNVEQSAVLFDEVVKAGIRHVVFSSTAAVYASKDDSLSETDELKPANVYGETKLAMEQELKRLSDERGLKVAILRYFNAAGASLLTSPPVRGEAHQPESHLIPNAINVAMDGRDEFVINGGDYPTPDGTCIRDYIHVDDLAEAHLLALQALVDEKFDYDVFNLGSGNGFSNKEVMEVIKKVSGSDMKVSTGSRREGDAVRLIANSEKSMSVLDWTPKHGDLETIIKSAWDWHKSHPKGYSQ